MTLKVGKNKEFIFKTLEPHPTQWEKTGILF